MNRNQLIEAEKNLFLGENLELSDEESKVDEYIIKLKCEELEAGYHDPSSFLPLQHFSEVKKNIENSEVFKFLRKVPKGCSLHTHLVASSSVDFIVKELTYDSYACGKYINEKLCIKFMQPNRAKEENYKSLKEIRDEDENFDNWLKSELTLFGDATVHYTSCKTIWEKFQSIFSDYLFVILCYKPAFEMFYHHCLEEHYNDNIMYVEFRGELLPLYDSDGNAYSSEDFFQTMLDVEENFKSTHRGFIGARFILAVYRKNSSEQMKKEIEYIIQMKKKFPKLIIGIDFVGMEDEGRDLIDFEEVIRSFENDIEFFFHVGETNWFGHIDTNLVDAVLMKTKRIGHGVALFKHPLLVDIVQEQNIAIEHCPISNQVLGICADPRIHPVIPLLAKGFPVVVCNDDPALWEAAGLSYDWYMTFMAMTPKYSGLKFLKQLAINSINHSALGEDKDVAMNLWKQNWNNFVSEMALAASNNG